MYHTLFQIINNGYKKERCFYWYTMEKFCIEVIRIMGGFNY